MAQGRPSTGRRGRRHTRGTGDDVADVTATLDRMLRANGARDLADALEQGHEVGDAFDRHRTSLSRAVSAATAAGERDAMRTAIQAQLEAGGATARVVLALLHDDRSRLPTPAPSAPPSPRPGPPPAPAEMTYAAQRTTPVDVPAMPPGSRAGDEFVWCVVGLAVVGVLVAVTASITTTLVLAPLLFVGQVVLLGLDRHGLGRTGLRGPAWGWVLFAPGYCYRRARVLGHAPRYAYALVAVGVAGRVAVSTFGVGGGPMIDTRRLADALNTTVERTWEVEATTDCPRFVEVVVGDEFTCTASMAQGAQYAVTYEIVDEDGRLKETDMRLTNLRSTR